MFTPPSFDRCVRVCLWFYHFTLNLLRSQGRPHHDWPFQMDNTREEEYASKQQMISSQTLWPHVFFQGTPRGTHHHHWPAGQEAEGRECLEPSLDLWLVAAGSHLDISLPLFNNIIHKMDPTIMIHTNLHISTQFHPPASIKKSTFVKIQFHHITNITATYFQH